MRERVLLAALVATATSLLPSARAADSPNAVAPEYRWELAPDYIAPASPKDAVGLNLDRFSVFLDCDAVCDLTTIYALRSEQVQTRTVTLLVPDPRSLRIELAHHPIAPAAPRKASREDVERYGFDPNDNPPPHYALYPAIDLELPLVTGPNELVVKQKLPMSTRGRGTELVVRVVQLNLWPLRSWTRGNKSELYINYSFGPAALTAADGLKGDRAEPACMISGYDYDKMEVPFVGYRDDQTGQVRYPMLYRFILPAMVECRLGAYAGLKLDGPTDGPLRGR